MSESQKHMAKRLFEILKAMGDIKEEKRYASSSMECLPELFLTMRFKTIKEWHQALTEAIGMYQGEEIGKEMEKLRTIFKINCPECGSHDTRGQLDSKRKCAKYLHVFDPEGEEKR